MAKASFGPLISECIQNNFSFRASFDTFVEMISHLVMPLLNVYIYEKVCRMTQQALHDIVIFMLGYKNSLLQDPKYSYMQMMK